MAQQLDAQYTLCLIFDQGTYGAKNVKTILNLVPELKENVLLLQDFAPMVLDPNTFEPVPPEHTYLFFHDIDSKDKFMSLFDELQQRHGWDATRDLIPQYQGSYVNGYLIPHHDEKAGPVINLARIEDYSPLWQWVLANCQHKVQWSRMFWFFENQNDAAMFRLKFSR